MTGSPSEACLEVGGSSVTAKHRGLGLPPKSEGPEPEPPAPAVVSDASLQFHDPTKAPVPPLTAPNSSMPLSLGLLLLPILELMAQSAALLQSPLAIVLQAQDRTIPAPSVQCSAKAAAQLEPQGATSPGLGTEKSMGG